MGVLDRFYVVLDGRVKIVSNEDQKNEGKDKNKDKVRNKENILRSSGYFLL
jgi:nitroimidazol reductase NimA-like FMN-containing flavoprotein (pyridoxamine 5'-phosphate oxidase superfamily)